MFYPQSCQAKGGQSWKSQQPTSNNQKTTKSIPIRKHPKTQEVESAARTAANQPFAPATAPHAPTAAGQNAPKHFSFFERELRTIQHRFNQTFGRQVVVNVKTSCNVVLAIVGLGLLHREIVKACSPDLVQIEICRFVRCSRTLNRIFNQMERCSEREKSHEKQSDHC